MSDLETSESGRFNSPFAFTRFLPTLMATFKPNLEYFFLKSLYFWFARATNGVKNTNFLPFKASVIPASSPTRVLPEPVALTTSKSSPLRSPSLMARYWTGNSFVFPESKRTCLNFFGIFNLFISTGGMMCLDFPVLSNNVRFLFFIASKWGDKTDKVFSRLPVFSNVFLRFLKIALSNPWSFNSSFIVSWAHSLQISWLLYL